MRSTVRIASPWLLALVLSPPARGEVPSFDGEWRTTFGIMKLKQDGDKVTGSFGNAGQFPITGKFQGEMLVVEYKEGSAQGKAGFTLDSSGNAFTGGFQINGRGGKWEGWRPDPEATRGPRANFGGFWLTDLGLMELTQNGDKVTGKYAVRGTSDIEGEVKGRRLEFHNKSFRDGKGWFDLSKDGKALAGAGNTSGFPGWYGWRGRPAPEYARHAKPVAGKIVDGSTNGLLTYSVHAPEGFSDKGNVRYPAIVLLHGSNMDARSYVATFAAAWPDLAKKYLLLGINGETPSNTGPEPRFNYSYVNFVGKSTFRGFPGTDRESPALVSEALAELKDQYPIKSYFVGGHSQGGFLTYSLLMNYPDLIAGAFPISCGVIFQCEPDAYDNKTLRAAQRAVPLAIIHGKNDPVVPFNMGEYAAGLFGDAGWPAFHFFTDDSAGHMFARLPVGDAVRWLETQASDDPATLLAAAESSLKRGADRDAVAALSRARKLNSDVKLKEKTRAVAQAIDAKVRPGAKEYLAKIKDNKDGRWIGGFLAYRDRYEFADAARDVMTAFDALRARHDGPARKALGEARAAFAQGRQADGYARYQEIVDKEYASSLYRNAKRWLAERK
jgi:predicted esterase